jgi:hypothetical protein
MSIKREGHFSYTLGGQGPTNIALTRLFAAQQQESSAARTGNLASHSAVISRNAIQMIDARG